MVAVELEGGVWSGGRHTRGRGFIEDCDKYNAATGLGWAIFRFTSEHLKKKPAECCELVKRAIHQRSLTNGRAEET